MRSVKKLRAARVTAVLAAGLSVALAVPAWCQDPQSQGPVIRSQVNLVNVFVTVRDKNKRIATDLDGVLLEETEARRRATGVEDSGLGALDRVSEPGGLARNPGQML